MLRSQRKKVGLYVLVGLILVVSNCKDTQTLRRPRAQDPTKCSRDVIAEVGDAVLRVCDLSRYMTFAKELEKQFGLDAYAESDFHARLKSALGFLALSVEAKKQLDDEDWIEEQKQRLMVRVYLDRIFGQMEMLPVSKKELSRAFQNEVERFEESGESDLYRPTTVDAVVVMVGYFPDFHRPQKGLNPVLLRDSAEKLVKEIEAAFGEQVADLDDFLAMAREVMHNYPTVKIKEYARLPVAVGAPGLEAGLQKAILALNKNGDIGEPVWFSGGAYIVRRGVTRPGKGESIADIQNELSDRVRVEKTMNAYQRQIDALKLKYNARSWPEKLKQNEIDKDLIR